METSPTLILTFNPSLDHVMTLQTPIKIGEIHRTSQSLISAGGKGLNVVRALHCALPSSQVNYIHHFGILGGLSGTHLQQLVTKEFGVENDQFQWFWLPSQEETRSCFLISSSMQKQLDTTVFNGEGPLLTDSSFDLFSQTVQQCVEEKNCKVIVLSGSVLRGFSFLKLSELLQKWISQQRIVFVDTSKEPLKTILQNHCAGLCLKVNYSEICDAMGWKMESLESRQSKSAFCQTIFKTCVEQQKLKIVIISIGKYGAIVVTLNEQFHISAPQLTEQEFVSSIGCGDVLMGAFIASIIHDNTESMTQNLKAKMRYAVTCATLNALHSRPGIFSKDDIEKYISQCTITSFL